MKPRIKSHVRESQKAERQRLTNELIEPLAKTMEQRQANLVTVSYETGISTSSVYKVLQGQRVGENVVIKLKQWIEKGVEKKA